MCALAFGDGSGRPCALGILVCLAARTVLAAECPGPSRRTRHLANPGGRSEGASPNRHHAISGNPAAPRPRGGADIRRRAAAAKQQSNPGYSRRRMREGDFLHCRPNGPGLSGRRPQAPRRRPHHRHPQPESSAHHEPDVARAAQQEIDAGIASVTAALGDGAPAPFFRVPGLLRGEGVENYLASRGIQIWSADFLADDWRHISASRVYELAIKRLEEKGRGILLLHDIHARTVAALPRILHELKVRGYHIVHVVPATPELPATPTEPQQWQLHPPSETVAISHWPKIPNFVFADAGALAAPALSDLDWRSERSLTLAELQDHHAGRGGHGIPLPREAPWPRQLQFSADSTAIALPIPARESFEIPEKSYAVIAMASSHQNQSIRADRETDRVAKPIVAGSGTSRRTNSRRHAGRARGFGGSHMAAHRRRIAAHAGRRELRHLVQIRRRSV